MRGVLKKYPAMQMPFFEKEEEAEGESTQHSTKGARIR